MGSLSHECYPNEEKGELEMQEFVNDGTREIQGGTALDLPPVYFPRKERWE